MTKRLIISAMLLFAGISLSAENTEKATDSANYTEATQASSVKAKWRAPFSDNWTLSISAGGQAYLGEHYSAIKKGSLIVPSASIELGKWFAPWIGARAGVNGFMAKGVSPSYHVTDNPVKRKADTPHWLKDQRFPYFNAHIDLMGNLSNLFAGYKEGRRFHVIGAIGPGIAYTWDDPATSSFSLNGSLFGTYALSNKIDLKFGADAMMVNENFDGDAGGRKIEGAGAVTVGIVWHISDKGWSPK